jgi:kynureninase
MESKPVSGPSFASSRLLLFRSAPRCSCFVQPRAASQRGSQLSLRLRGGRHRGREVFDAMVKAGAVMDWREPDVLRLSFVPLYNRFADVARFCELLATALARQDPAP